MAEHNAGSGHDADPGIDPGPATGQSPAEPYTVYPDADLRATPVGSGTAVDSGTPDDAAVEATDPTRRTGPDPVALVAGLAALLIAVLAVTDVLDAVDPRWALAAVAIGVGGTVLLATLRRRGA